MSIEIYSFEAVTNSNMNESQYRVTILSYMGLAKSTCLKPQCTSFHNSNYIVTSSATSEKHVLHPGAVITFYSR